jgi:hypothetical protein
MENDPTLSPSPHVEVRDEALKQLRMLVHATAISVLILTGTLFIFLYRQVVSLRKNTTELVNYIVEYERSNATEFIGNVHSKFAEYRSSHPDFAPIYMRYFGTNLPPQRQPGGTNAIPGSKVIPAPPQ